MTVYVIGAGVSKTTGYPLGAELFGEVDAYIRNRQSVSDTTMCGVADPKNWFELCTWLDCNPNPLIKEAYRIKHFEYLFTILDSAWALQRHGVNEITLRHELGKPTKYVPIDAAHKPYFLATSDYVNHRSLLQWALSAYLRLKHHEDSLSPDDSRWRSLQGFARKLHRGDVIITFNYDSTLERVLFRSGLWTPDDGYGFSVHLQRSWTDSTPVSYGPSGVTTLHLHGALGWYNKYSVTKFYIDEAEGHARPLISEIQEDPVSLDRDFLEDLGVQASDSHVISGFPALLYPSYLKAFGSPAIRPVFLNLWHKAAQALRGADKIVVIGYSMPEADSAALTLLLTNCDRERLRIVNNNKKDCNRLSRLLTKNWLNDDAQSFDGWLNETTDQLR